MKKKYHSFSSAAAVLGIVLLLAGVGFAWSFNQKKEKELTTASHFPSFLPPTLTPTLPPPSPTPTLTPQQIAEIRRREFNDWNQKHGPCKYVPILMYHHVLAAEAAKTIGATSLNVPPDVLRQQVDYLIGKGYQIIRLDEMVEGLRNGSLPPKPVVLTFDDGYNNFYDNVYSLLREKNLKATVFVISQFVGGDRYLNWGEIKEMSDSGLVLIGDHTLNHRSLPSLSLEEERNQIISAKIIIEDHIQRTVAYFAYPYGGINAGSEQILGEAGFAGAVVTTNSHPQCLGLPYEFSRIRIGTGSLSRYGL